MNSDTSQLTGQKRTLPAIIASADYCAVQVQYVAV